MKQSASRNLSSLQKRLIILFAIVGVLLVALSAGIGIWKLHQANKEEVEYQLPDFVYGPGAPADAERAYLGAIEHGDLLSKIPCYCGCGEEAGHESVYDCYIASREGNDIQFDGHAAG